MYEREYGNNYNSEMSTTDIAKQIRAWVKGQKKSGNFPKGLKVSVRSQYFSGGSAIRIYITALPTDWEVFNRKYVELTSTRGHPNMHPYPSRYTERVEKIRAEIMSYVNSFNYDGSEIQVDYFDVNFYCHAVELDWEKFYDMEQEFIAKVKSQIANG